MTGFILTHPSFENVMDSARSIVGQMDDSGFRPSRIIALARGGAVLGVILSHKLNVPVTIVSYSSKAGKGDDRNHANILPTDIEGDLLIVDDLTDSGNSMDEVVEHFKSWGGTRTVLSATMYAKEGGVCTPTYFWHWLPKNAPFIHFPWEMQ